MIGAIVGDVLGSWYESRSTKDREAPLLRPLARPTDDTVLSVAVAAAILADETPPTEQRYGSLIRHLGRLYPNAGYGGNFIRWLADESMGPYNSYGNGSAMRVSAVGWAFDSEKEVLEQAARSARPSHNHPEGVKGAQAVALAVYLSRKGVEKELLRGILTERFGYDLDRTVDAIRPRYRFDVTCQGSVPEAIIAFLDSTDYEDAVRNAISLGGDADTQACIAGAIAEAHYGGVPDKLLAYVLPRLDDRLLGIVLSFARRYVPKETRQAVEIESGQRRGGDSAEESRRYCFVTHAESWTRLVDYQQRVAGDPHMAGRRLRASLENLEMARTNAGWFLQALVDTKKPQVYAESEVAGDGTDWTLEELQILGDVSVAVPVTVFDDGRHTRPSVHEEPFEATLLFVPGALLRNGREREPADWNVVAGRSVDNERYTALYERRLHPVLHYASSAAAGRGHRALVTIPGLGCGQFAGPFRGRLGTQLRNAIRAILERHVDDLPGIRAVWFDPYSECRNERHEIGDLSFFVRPLTRNQPGLPQLCRPTAYQETGDDFADCELFSVVAWDHVSWPGNDFFCGSRATDDGVKAAATSSMFALTGVCGQYDPVMNVYRPPRGVRTWADLVAQNGMRLQTVENTVLVGRAPAGDSEGAFA